MSDSERDQALDAFIKKTEYNRKNTVKDSDNKERRIVKRTETESERIDKKTAETLK